MKNFCFMFLYYVAKRIWKMVEAQFFSYPGMLAATQFTLGMASSAFNKKYAAGTDPCEKIGVRFRRLSGAGLL
jgi:hypothetical protein